MSLPTVVRTSVLLALVLGAARAAPAGDWTLRLFGAVVEPTGETTVAADPGGLEVALASAGGAGIAAAYRVAPRWELELGVLASQPSIDLTIEAVPPTVRLEESLGIIPISLGAYWVATPEARVRLYLGPQVALVRYDSLEVEVGMSGVSEEVQVDSDLGIGVLVGLDVPFGTSRWMLNATVRYLETSAAPDDASASIRVDPFILTLGVGVRL
jgi:outer membrane protein W